MRLFIVPCILKILVSSVMIISLDRCEAKFDQLRTMFATS